MFLLVILVCLSSEAVCDPEHSLPFPGQKYELYESRAECIVHAEDMMSRLDTVPGTKLGYSCIDHPMFQHRTDTDI